MTNAPDSTDTEAEDPTTLDDTPAERTVPRRRFLLAAALAALFALVSVFLAVVAAGLNEDLDQERADRDDVARVAGEFSAALLTYDHERLDDARERVLALSTGRFHREYEQAFAGLSELIETTRSRATATVKDVFVGEIDGESARVITVVDAEIRGTAGRRQALDSYILLDLVRAGAGWKVDGVTSLNFTRGGLPGPAPEGQPGEGAPGGDSPPTTEE